MKKKDPIDSQRQNRNDINRYSQHARSNMHNHKAPKKDSKGSKGREKAEKRTEDVSVGFDCCPLAAGAWRRLVARACAVVRARLCAVSVNCCIL